MTTATIRQRLAQIGRAVQADNLEAAHRLEDTLYFDVLFAIWRGGHDATEAAALAEAALGVRQIVFRRGYAQ